MPLIDIRQLPIFATNRRGVVPPTGTASSNYVLHADSRWTSVAGGAGITNVNISAGTTSNLLSALTFADSNGLAFGLNASTITGSYTVPSTAGLISAVNISAGTTSNNLTALTFANSNGVTFGLNASTITASVGAGASPVISWFDNMKFDVAEIQANNITACTHSLFFFPLLPGENFFPGDITAQTMQINLSISGSTATLSSSHSSYFSFGIYSLSNNSSSFALINSWASTWASGAASNNSTAYMGRRFLTINSTQWSSDPIFRYGSSYFGALIYSRNNAIPQTMGVYGQYVPFGGIARSGTIGSSIATNVTMGASPFYGVYSVTTGALPAGINITELRKVTGGAQPQGSMVPQVIFNNITSSY